MSIARSRDVDGFAPHPDVTALRERGASARVTNLVGHEITLVATCASARAVHGDPALLRLDELPPPPGMEDRAEEARRRTVGSLLALDPPDHTRLRRPLTAEFTVRRVRALRPRVTEIVDAALDDLAAAGPGADLVSLVALPVPSLVICELLGVPYADRDAFGHRATALLDARQTQDQRTATHRANCEYMLGLVERHRAEPADDLLSMLVRRQETDDDPLTDAELVGLANLLLVAGHETTANMISLSTLALLRHPDQLALVRDADESTDAGAATIAAAVEELLRFLSVVHTGFARRATEDTVVDGHPIAAGEMVAASLCAANRDPALRGSGAPLDELDVTREPGPHLAFGHGIHHCLGAPLARMELAVALPALLRRFPGLALAEPGTAPVFRPDSLIHGLETLPLSW